MKINDKDLPNFVVIESQILVDNRISAMEKLVYSYICLLNHNDRLSCFANNKYLAGLFKKSERQIQNYLRNLKKYNYITTRYDKFNHRLINTTINTFLDTRSKINDEIELLQQNFDFEYNWLGDKDSE